MTCEANVSRGGPRVLLVGAGIGILTWMYLPRSLTNGSVRTSPRSPQTHHRWIMAMADLIRWDHPTLAYRPDRQPGRRRRPAACQRAGACVGLNRYAVLGNIASVDDLIVHQVGQSDRRRGGENVTVVLYSVRPPVRCRTGTSVSTLTPESFRACCGPSARRDRMPPMSQ
jgi:hypothetical protein